MQKASWGAADLVELVHIVGQQIDDLAGGRLPHGHVTEAKRLKQKRGTETYVAAGTSSHTWEKSEVECVLTGPCVMSGERGVPRERGSGDPRSAFLPSTGRQPHPTRNKGSKRGTKQFSSPGF